MFSSQNGSQTQQNVDCQRHCILVAASNPYPLPTPVYRPPQLKNLEKTESMEAQTESRLSDAEAVAKSFAQVLLIKVLHLFINDDSLLLLLNTTVMLILNFSRSFLFLCQLFVQNSFRSLEQSTMR